MSKSISQWGSKQLRDICNIHYGKSPNVVKVDYSKFKIWGTGGMSGYSSKKLFNGPFTLIGRKGTISKPIWIEDDSWVIDTAYSVEAKKNVDGKFLHYLLETSNLEELNESTGVPSLSRETLYKFKTILPDNKKEQEKIAEILTSVDKVIELTEIEIEKLKNLKKGMMQDLLTKGIGHTKFKDSPIGKIPESWEVKKLKSVCRLEDGKRKPIKGEDRINIQGGFPYYGASGIIDYINDYIFSGPRVLLGEDGENINSRNLPLAFIADGKYWVNNHAHVINTLDNDINYICEYLESIDYLPFSSGSAQPKLTSTTVDNLLLKVPPIEEQTKIGIIINSMNSNIRIKKEKLYRLKNMKKGLMQDLLTGKVRVKV